MQKKRNKKQKNCRNIRNIKFRCRFRCRRRGNTKRKFIIKEIEREGNCFYRTISYYYRNTQEDYTEFRELITSYIINNPDDYIFFFTDEDINAAEELDQNVKNKKKNL